uniref:RNA binding protein n=1 Tax=Arundo donax TaxID=35708 RepID=A0A0A9DXP2_ARUDO
MSKGNEENEVANGNGKLTHEASKSLMSPKKDTTVNNTSKSPSDFVSSLTISTTAGASSTVFPSKSLAISKSDVKTGDGDHPVTSIAPKSPTSKDINCHSNHAANGKSLEDIGPRDTDIEKLAVRISSAILDGKDEIQSMTWNQQPDAEPCTFVVGPMVQNFDKDQSHLKLAELPPSENKDTVLSCQNSSDKHLDWSSGLQSCSVIPLNDIVNSSMNTDRHHTTLLDGSDLPSYSSFARFANTSHTLLWNDEESKSNPTFTIGSRASSMMQTGLLSSTDNTYALLNGGQDGLGTVYTHGNVSGHPGMENHQPRAASSVRTDSIGSFDKTVSVNKDESRIISDILSSEFNPWDDSYSTANNFVRMLRESEYNDVPFTVPSWKSGTSSKESRFSFARQDNQGNFLDSSLRNCGSEQNFSLLSQNSCGNVCQNGLAFHSLENVYSNSNPLALSDMATTGTSRSKISAPPGFSAPARVPPPGFSSGFPSQDCFNPPPRFSSGISSQDGSIPPPRLPSAFSSGISSQEGSNLPSRFPSAFSSQDGPNPPSRFPSASSSPDGPNPPSRFPPTFSSGFSSQDGSNQVYGSTYSETRFRDNLLGGNTNHYQPQLARQTSDLEFIDPAILAVGKGRMPGIGDARLEMKSAPAFPVQLQTSNNDPRIQLLMQQNQNARFADHIQDAFNPMNDNYLASRLLAQNDGSLSPYAQMAPQQARNSAHKWSLGWVE